MRRLGAGALHSGRDAGNTRNQGLELLTRRLLRVPECLRRIGAKLLVGSYYSQSIQMWSALVVGSLMAAILVTAVGVTERLMLWRMGARAR